MHAATYVATHSYLVVNEDMLVHCVKGNSVLKLLSFPASALQHNMSQNPLAPMLCMQNTLSVDHIGNISMPLCTQCSELELTCDIHASVRRAYTY